ncbi:kinetochore protein ndc80, partial [Copidosoma floridanum]|uniref:kinetochore protein ndc80 n=1 Tax=Copidosoma floridanum TaxID=29053 RepID=UPI000C6F8C2C
TKSKMRKSSNPGTRFSSQETDRNSVRMDPSRRTTESMIPKPKMMRSSSSDRLSGMRKSNLRPTTGAKTSLGQYTTASSMVSPMPSSRYTHTIEKSSRASNVDPSNLASKGYITPMASGSRHTGTAGDNRNVRASSAERASALVPKGPKKDNRPLSDKNYQNEMLNKIDNYFHSIGQSTILNSNGSLKPLTLKIFIDATNLLVKLLDIKQSLSSANYIEEIPKIAKKLHYPGSMNKSWLKTANTPHSWPQAIGWISWLVELCEVKDVASEIFTLERLPVIGQSEEEKENRRSIFLSMIKCYKAWNEEKPEEEDRILHQFFRDEAERRGVSDEKYEEINAEYEKAQENLKIEQAQTDKVNEEVSELQQILVNLKSDRIKQQEQIAERQIYIDKTKKDIDNLAKEAVKFSKDVEKLEAAKEELRNAIKHQPMSVVQRDEIVKTCTEQQTYIQNFDAHLEEIKKEAYSLDIRLVSSKTNLEKAILAYNQSLFLQLSDSKTNIDELLMPENGICKADFMGRLEEKKALMNNYMQECSRELLKSRNMLESYGREKETMKAKKDVLSEKVEKKKATDEKKKQDFRTKEFKKREEIKKLQTNIDELSEQILKMTNEMDTLNQQLTICAEKKEAVMKQKAYLKDYVKPFLDQMIDILDENQSELCKILESYEKDISF